MLATVSPDRTIQMRKPKRWSGDLWGGLAAMLVALPSAIAFGVTIFAPLGSGSAAAGALAGILGTFAIGLVAAALGGTDRLISAPCAPAAAVLAAFAIEQTQHGGTTSAVLALLTLVTLLGGGLQLLFGAVGLGRLIKYMPYPVVSGYLSGVGLIIIVGQVPKLLGVPKAHFFEALLTPSLWRWPAIAVGLLTIAVMVLAPRLTKKVPAAILALVSGVLAYLLLGLVDGSLLALDGNALVIGRLGDGSGHLLDAVVERGRGLLAIAPADLARLFVPALTLAVLLSIDTLKTCVVLDALTRSRHDSNRELIGQGLGNLAAGLVGGVPGAGTMGATLVALSSGALSRRAGLIEGALALVAFLLLGPVISWVPVAALAGILIVVGVRMFDRHSLRLLRSRSTILDFAVIVAVVIVAETVSLIAASGVGIALAIVLFIREQIGGAVVRRKTFGNQVFSKLVRLPEERAVLEKRGDQTVVYELQGSLFFGTADQLHRALETEIGKRSTLILDLRRVQTIDVTAAHVLELVEDAVAEHRGHLVFSGLPRAVPSGRDLQALFDQIGLVQADRRARSFGELDEALAWAEEQLLDQERLERSREQALELREIELFKQRKAETLAELQSVLSERSCTAGERIFGRGDPGDELFLIRRGSVRITLTLADGQSHHLATFGRGDFFGEMAFLDRGARSADASAVSDCQLFVLSRARFDALTADHPKLAGNLLEGLALALAQRLRQANAELHVLHQA